jgi:hypothetical protein
MWHGFMGVGNMKKPKRIFAIFLWVLGLIFLAGAALKALAYILEAFRLEFRSGPAVTNGFLLSPAYNFVTTAFLDGAVLAGLAVLIELVDQILWNGLSEDQRLVRLNSSRRFLRL